MLYLYDVDGMFGGWNRATAMCAYIRHSTLQVMDNLVSSLSKFTVLLDPATAKAAVEFGNSEKARMACDAAFQLANRRALACSSTAPVVAHAPQSIHPHVAGFARSAHQPVRLLPGKRASPQVWLIQRCRKKH